MHTEPAYFKPGFRTNAAETDVAALEVSGDFPLWLEGSLLRNGPGMVEADKPMRHWFDGLAMLHRFQMKNGQVSYKSRFLECRAYQSYQETGRFLYSDFATDPCRSLFGKLQTLFSKDPLITDSAKVNVGRMGRQAFALGEPLMQIQIDPDTLKSVGVYDFGLEGRSRMTTAHPLNDGDRSYNLVVEYGPINFYSIFEIGAQTRKVASIPVLHPAYLHSFGMSENYFIIAEFPLVVQSLKLALRLKPFIENFKWKPENGSRFIIIDRKTGRKKAVIKCDSFFSFHHVNAFEDQGRLVVDMATYPDASIIQSYYASRLEDDDNVLPFGRMERFELDVQQARLLSRKIVSDACIELPHIDVDHCHGIKDYRFVYGCGVHDTQREGFYNQLVRIDMQTGETLTWHVNGCYPGEPVFVAHPDAQSESDGVLLSVVLDASKMKSFLLVINATTMQEQARAYLPHTVPFGYHGSFVN